MSFRQDGRPEPHRESRPEGMSSHARKGKTPPPEETFEEASYLKMLGEKQRPVSVKLAGGEVVHGWIEYYDRNMIRLTREDAPNLFIFKHEILYIQEAAGKRPVRPNGS
jgi:host factor-I protein